MPAKLRIPDSWVAPLTKLIQLTPEELNAFLAAMQGQEPNLALTALTNAIAERLSMDRRQVDQIVRSLARLQTVRESIDLSIEDFLLALRSALEATGKTALVPQDWEAFLAAVGHSLSGETAIAVSAKALQVMSQNQRLYCSAQVLSDLRPIFKSDVGQDPVAFVAIHNLKVTYHEGKEHKDFFVALNKEDAEHLCSVLGRALKKEASLRNLASAKGLQIIEFKP